MVVHAVGCVYLNNHDINIIIIALTLSNNQYTIIATI